MERSKAGTEKEVPTAKLELGPTVPQGSLSPEAVDELPTNTVTHTYNPFTTPWFV